MRILFHICCAPCALFPLTCLAEQGHAVTGFFFNHNIHPYQEFKRRLDAVRELEAQAGLTVIYQEEYLLEEFLAAVAATPENRCPYCYASRLDTAASQAVELGFDAFSTSLLYSRYQSHEDIRRAGERAAERHGIPFYYEDYRPGWQAGIIKSKELGLYRQQYCGCIYSEKERYYHP